MAMEMNRLMPGRVVIAFDATRDRGERELKLTIDNVLSQVEILHGGDTLTLLGVLHRVLHPMGYHMQASAVSFTGTNIGAMKDEVAKKVDMYVNMLLQSANECESKKVDIEVKMTAGTPIKNVVLQEVTTYNATWLILDRYLTRDLRFYLKQIPSRVAVIEDNMSVKIMRCHPITNADNVEFKLAFSMSKPVPILTAQDNETVNQSVVTCESCPDASMDSLESDMLKNNLASSLHRSREHSFSSSYLGSSSKQDKPAMSTGRNIKEENKFPSAPPTINKQRKNPIRQQSSDAPVLCNTCGRRTELYMKDSMRFSFSEIQLATEDFSTANLLGEGGYGLVYKGELKDRQLIAAKVRKEESTQGFSEFHSEVHVLSFARHKNIVMLLGYCCKENLNILVYEYICNKSLDWHLFDTTANVLEWHKRHDIAIGTAKGLRYLHEECRGSPIIHRDMRPSNILLTHDFVPMLGDFGLAKWKTNSDPIYTRILGTFGYLAPEYAENGIVSVRTDVYSFGIVLIQLISGRKVVDLEREDQQQSLRQWAEPLIESLALHKLADPRLEESYDTYELYHMARAAYLCVQSNPDLRPSMGEVVRLLEGENFHFYNLAEQFIPHFTE
ncbi:Proline-rich receptor-like protein kinase [Actinidia chinensis var. chinensis]|uniref:Proline-rich receptor-like protein kinase n=1 Tax=Actinidia chinensis var. chinensis TaxID=1590841 RepID=A0A2R6QYT0_ACTCC|nr:Proline-rich receptor-like protein kinase [Actinidia chinensis var. chinensis]